MAAKKHPPGLSLAGIPKPALDNILHHLLLQQVQAGAYKKPQTGNQQKAPNQKQETSNGFTTPRHRFTLYQYYKNYRLLSRLKGKALALLKTQYAKKPKNPV